MLQVKQDILVKEGHQSILKVGDTVTVPEAGVSWVSSASEHEKYVRSDNTQILQEGVQLSLLGFSDEFGTLCNVVHVPWCKRGGTVVREGFEFFISTEELHSWGYKVIEESAMKNRRRSAIQRIKGTSFTKKKVIHPDSQRLL